MDTNLYLYCIDEEYASFLYEADGQVMRSFGNKTARPYVGPFQISGCSFYIPFTTKEHDFDAIERIPEGITFMKVYHGNELLGGVRINRAIPVPEEYLRKISFLSAPSQGKRMSERDVRLNYESEWVKQEERTLTRNLKTVFRHFYGGTLKQNILNCTCNFPLLIQKQKEFCELPHYYSIKGFSTFRSLGAGVSSFFLHSDERKVALREVITAINNLRRSCENGDVSIPGLNEGVWEKISFANAKDIRGFLLFEASGLDNDAAVGLLSELTRTLEVCGYVVDPSKNLWAMDCGNSMDNSSLQFSWEDSYPVQHKNGWDARIKALHPETGFFFVVGGRNITEKEAGAVANLDRYGMSQLPPLAHLAPGFDPPALSPRSKSRHFQASDLRRRVPDNCSDVTSISIFGVNQTQIANAFNQSLYRDAVSVYGMAGDDKITTLYVQGVTAGFVNEIVRLISQNEGVPVRGYGIYNLDVVYSDGTTSPDLSSFSLRIQDASRQPDGRYTVLLSLKDKETGLTRNFGCERVPENAYAKCLQAVHESIEIDGEAICENGSIEKERK